MKNWTRILIGVVIGTIISGGLWVWSAPIQSLVGINIFDSSTSTWNPVPSGSSSSVSDPTSWLSTPITNTITVRNIQYSPFYSSSVAEGVGFALPRMWELSQSRLDNVAGTDLNNNYAPINFAVITGKDDSGFFFTLHSGAYPDNTTTASVTDVGDGTVTNNLVVAAIATGKRRVANVISSNSWDAAFSGNFGEDNITALGTTGGAIYTLGFNLGWDGSNWDRLRVDSAGSLQVNIPSLSIESNAFSNITTNTSTVVKASSGTLNNIVTNVAGTTSNVRLYNDASAPCDTNFVLQLDTTSVVQDEIHDIDHNFTTGICALTAGGAAADITVLYR